MAEKKIISISFTALDADIKTQLAAFKRLEKALEKGKSNSNDEKFAVKIGQYKISALIKQGNKALDISNRHNFEHLKKQCNKAGIDYAALSLQGEQTEEKTYLILFLAERENLLKFMKETIKTFERLCRKYAAEERRRKRAEERKGKEQKWA